MNCRLLAAFSIVAIAWGDVGCGGEAAERAERAEKRLAETSKDLATKDTEVATLRRQIEEGKDLNGRQAKEFEEEKARLEGQRNIMERSAEEARLETRLAGMISLLESDAVRRDERVSKELLEAKDEPQERKELIRTFWRKELAEIRRLKTLEDLVAISKAIHEYRRETGQYPLSGNKNLLACLSKKSKAGGEPFLRPRSGIVSVDGELLDVWGRPYVYIENRSRTPRYSPNTPTYLLYSVGPNGKDETFPDPDPYGDDICNW